MKIELAKLIAEYSDGEVSVLEDYSGRGMFGKTTGAVVCPSMGIMMSIISTILIEGDLEEIELVKEESYSFKNLRHDEFGKSDIVIY